MMNWTQRWGHLCAVLLGLTVLFVGAPIASAHTDFDSSTPAQSDVVAEPVSEVVVVFSADTRPVDDLLVALDANGTLQNPTGFTTDDQRTFNVTFDPPLAGGDIGIRWTVLGADGHPLEGSFAFSVTAPIPTADTAPSVTTAAASSEPPANETTATVETAAPVESSDDLSSPEESDETDETDEAVAIVDDVSGPAGETSVVAGAETQSLDEFLVVDADMAGDGRRLAGRLLSVPAVAGIVGALAFLAWTLRGPTREIVTVVSGIRAAGVVVAVGALFQYSGAVASVGESFATGWIDSTGRAMACRFVGAILVVVTLRSTTAQQSGSLGRRPRPLSAAVIDDPVTARPASRRRSSGTERWNPGSSKLALTGVALLVASFWFDGHTVSKGWRPLHAIVNSVHVVAGSIWFGGVITLAALAWWRYRRGDDARIGELVVRFSSIATVALVAVAVAGLVLAVIVLDGFGDLTGTEWGRTLMLKTAAVALAASLGAYNHFRLRPALVAAPDDVDVRATLRSALTAEAILLSFVVIATCWLVAAAT